MTDKVKTGKYLQSLEGKHQIYHNMWKEHGDIKGVAFIVHGLGEHCHRYDRIIEFLNSLNIRVYSFDHRGHGRTHHLIINEASETDASSNSNESESIKCKKQGYEGHIEVEKSIIMGDIKQLISQAAMDGIPDHVPKFLLGHSLGGLMVINYALERGDEEDEEFKKIKGLICIAPAIGICRPPNILLRSLAPLAAKIIPTFTIEGDIRLPDISRLPQVLESIEKDQMIHRKVSFGTGNIILKLCNELERRKDPKICIPTLFIHGTADKITDPLATQKFYKKLICPLKMLYLHQEGYHRLDPNSRYDNSLGLLTRKFVKLLKDSEEGILDLNFAAEKLEVQKRRIYDITNVLEGIGLIEKNSKNNVKWIGTNDIDPESSEVQRLQRLREEVHQLKKEELSLDRNYQLAQNLLKNMSEDEYNQKMAYLTHTDIRNIEGFEEETLLAVKAPYGSTLEVPDPDEGMPPGQRRYEVQLSSKSGPIDVFLIQDPVNNHSTYYNNNNNNNYNNNHNNNNNNNNNNSKNTHFHAAEMLKHFEIPPMESFGFEMKADEGVADLYGLGSTNNSVDVYSVFNDRRI